MAIRIDETAVGRMLFTLLEAAGGSGITIVHLGEPVPDNAGSTIFARPSGLTMERHPRRNADEVDRAVGTIDLAMAVPETQASGYAILNAISQIAAGMEFKTTAELGVGQSGHVLHTKQVTRSQSATLEDENESITFGTLTVAFEVERRTGESREDAIT